VNAAKNKHNTYKVGKSFEIDCTTRFDKKIRGIFIDCYRKRSKWITAIHRNNWTPVSERWICSHHFVSIC